MAVTIESVSVERREATQGEVALAIWGMPTVGGQTAGLKGSVTATAADGATLTLGLSKLDGEDAWTLDALSVNGCPSFANGYGCRYTRTKQLTNEEMIAALDAAAEGTAA